MPVYELNIQKQINTLLENDALAEVDCSSLNFNVPTINEAITAPGLKILYFSNVFAYMENAENEEEGDEPEDIDAFLASLDEDKAGEVTIGVELYVEAKSLDEAKKILTELEALSMIQEYSFGEILGMDDAVNFEKTWALDQFMESDLKQVKPGTYSWTIPSYKRFPAWTFTILGVATDSISVSCVTLETEYEEGELSLAEAIEVGLAEFERQVELRIS